MLTYNGMFCDAEEGNAVTRNVYGGMENRYKQAFKDIGGEYIDRGLPVCAIRCAPFVYFQVRMSHVYNNYTMCVCVPVPI